MKKTTMMLLLGLCCAAAGGCGGGVETSQRSGGGAGSGGGGTGGGAGAGGGGGGDGSCVAGDTCPNSQFCAWGPDSCAPNAKGACVYAIQCDGPPSGPACGCDGNVIEGEFGGCMAPRQSVPSLCAKGSFACGNLQCTKQVEVCVVKSGGPPPGTPSYSCAPLSDAAGTCGYGIADCSCMDLTKLGCADASCCKADADHQETISIALP